MRLPNRLTAIIVSMATGVLCGLPTQADILYVDDDANPVGDGLSWNTAFMHLQDALAAAADPNSAMTDIRVAGGVYNPDQDEAGNVIAGDPASSFSLLDGVAIRGGYAGYGASNPDARDVQTYVSILSGDLNGDDVYWENRDDNAFSVVESVGNDNTAVLDGFLVEGGQRGLSAANTSPFILNTTFYRNRTTGTGGGTYITGGAPIFMGCRFIDNWANNGGGAFLRSGSTALFSNCIFIYNHAESDGGGVYSQADPSFYNCSFRANLAMSGGTGHAILVHQNRVTTVNSIFWANTGGHQLYVGAGATLNTRYCAIQDGIFSGGIQGSGTVNNLEGNFNLSDPQWIYEVGPDGIFATPDDDLRLGPGSPCIDRGSNQWITSGGIDGNMMLRRFDDAYTADLGEGIAPIVDIGAYEYGSSLIPTRLYVDALAMGVDTGTSWSDAYTDLQTALATARYAGAQLSEVWVADGTYTPAGAGGSREASFHLVSNLAIYGGFAGDEVSFFERDPNAHVTVLSGDLNGDDQPGFVNYGDNSYHVVTAAGTSPSAVLDGFTIEGGAATGASPHDVGAGLVVDHGWTSLVDCRFTANLGDVGGAVYSSSGRIGLQDVRLGGNASGVAENGVLERYRIVLPEPLRVQDGTLQAQSMTIEGTGGILLGETAVLWISNAPSYDPATLRTIVTGLGDIVIDPGQTLLVESLDAVVDLSGRDPNDPNGPCADPNAASDWGTITVGGTLVVRDATIRNTNVAVNAGDLDGGTMIYNNEVNLIQNPPGWGGEFFVEGGAHIQCNVIRSDGDRYLDLDPDADSVDRPIISHNKFYVTIKQGVGIDQGELLELRSTDFDPNVGGGMSGAYQLSSSAGDGDPNGGGYNGTWAFERLQVGDPNRPAAKVNLTNRQGFVFQTPPEALYVKELKLYRGAVLNAALQRIYYQQLVDENGVPMSPPDPNDGGWLSNGARIIDVPLMGFSLKIIAMDDDNEFAVRIGKRLRDSADTQPELPPFKQGSIERIDDATFGGVMEMRTQATGSQSARSVAAHGAFARAGEDEIAITFDYLFTQMSSDPNQPTELVVYLSDSPDPSTNLVEVSRIFLPAVGPGSINGGRMAEFYGEFQRGGLNFTRGTYVELELRGQNASVLIDDFDPEIACTNQCGDVTSDQQLDSLDTTVTLAGYGQNLGNGTATGCFDIEMSKDGYIDLPDVLARDAIRAGWIEKCGYGIFMAPTPNLDPNPVAMPSAAELLITGKPGLAGDYQDYLYPIETSGACVGGSALTPASVPALNGDYLANGRLLTDPSGVLYQVHTTQGLIRLDTAEVIVAPSAQPVSSDPNNYLVYVGVNPQGWGDFLGLPFADAAFDPNDPDVVYVVPVVVEGPNFVPPPYNFESRYRAAAKLRLTGGGAYTVETIYGIDPEVDDTLGGSPPSSAPVKVQWVREIEVDSQNVYVISGHDSHSNVWGGNDWVLIYDKNDGQAETRVNISNEISAPIGLVVSKHDPNTLYVAASVDDLPDAQTRIWKYMIDRAGGVAMGLSSPQAITIDHPVDLDPNVAPIARVTSITEDPSSGTLYALGFAMPSLCDGSTTYLECDANLGEAIFTTPTLATIPSGETSPVTATLLDCHDLAFPISVAFLGESQPSCPGDLDGDSSVGLSDLATLLASYGQASGMTYYDGDLDGDGDVDLSDLATLLAVYGTTCE